MHVEVTLTPQDNVDEVEEHIIQNLIRENLETAAYPIGRVTIHRAVPAA